MAQNFTMYAGDTKIITVTVTDDDDEAVDLTGATIRWQASRLVVDEGFDADPLISKDNDTGGGIESASPSTGVFEVTLDPDDTEDLSGLYYHEAEVIDADGNVATVMTGRMTVVPVLIRPA